MSVTISTDIFCDVCSQWNPDVTQTDIAPQVRKARQFAKRRGWKFNGREDFCPDCDPTRRET